MRVGVCAYAVPLRQHRRGSARGNALQQRTSKHESPPFRIGRGPRGAVCRCRASGCARRLPGRPCARDTIGDLRRARHPFAAAPGRSARAGLNGAVALALAARARAGSQFQGSTPQETHAHEHDDRIQEPGRAGPPEDDAVRGVRRDAGRARRHRRVRHRRLGLHGRARPLPAGRHPLHLRSRTSRAPATWPTAIRACRAATACASRRTAPASPTSSPRSRPPTGRIRRSSSSRPRPASMTHGPRRLPGDRAAADLLQDHQVPGAT